MMNEAKESEMGFRAEAGDLVYVGQEGKGIAPSHAKCNLEVRGGKQLLQYESRDPHMLMNLSHQRDL